MQRKGKSSTSAHFEGCYALALIKAKGTAQSDLTLDERNSIGAWIFKQSVLEGKKEFTVRSLKRLTEILVDTNVTMPGVAEEMVNSWIRFVEESPNELRFNYDNMGGDSGHLKFKVGYHENGNGRAPRKVYIFEDSPRERYN